MNKFDETKVVSAKDMLKNEINKNLSKTTEADEAPRKHSLDMDIPEYLSYAVGKEKYKGHISNSTVLTTLLKFSGTPNSSDTENPDKYSVVSQRRTNNAEIRAYFLPNGFVNLDLIFPTGFDPELSVILNQLERYGTMANSSLSFNEENKEYPLQQIEIMPIEFIGESYMTFENPIMFVLTASSPGESTSLDTIRLLFRIDDVSINEITETDISEALDEMAYAARFSAEYDYE